MLGAPFSERGRLERDDERLTPAVEAVEKAIASVLTQVAELGLGPGEPIGELLAWALRAQIAALPRKDGVAWSAELRPGAFWAVADLCVVADIQLGENPPARRFLLRLERAERIEEQREALIKAAEKIDACTPAAAIGVIDVPAGIRAVLAQDHSRLTFPARERSVALEDVFRACFAGGFGDTAEKLPALAARTLTITAGIVW
jgi:hypothetical protein